MNVRRETPADLASIHQVHCSAFGQGVEARLVDALRDGGHVRESLVAEVAGQVVGHILFSDLWIAASSQTMMALALAPLAVIPKFQRQGIGSELVRCGIDACRQQGHRIVVVLGHPDYYPRFGFSAELARNLHSPYSGPAWMALELVTGALDGVSGRVQYSPPFDQL